MPEDYRFRYEPGEPTENAKKFIASLSNDMDALAIHNAVFEFAKSNDIQPKELFAEVYQALIRKQRGPRLGKLVAALGVEKVKKDIGV
jgi:lysyl-tRNA synthetase class 1